MANIRLTGLAKTWPGGTEAVRPLDLAIADGELLAVVGPSGCGKSTLLRLVAGLEQPTGGTVHIGGRDVTGVPPERRDIAMVFQSYALYPHKTVRDNLAFPLRMRGMARAEIERRVVNVARVLGIEALLERRPRALSGGQRQRVALGRAMVREPLAFLLDEPLSNLDARLRVETRAELARMQRTLGATMLYVTHDQEEALTLGDRVAVMNQGALQQVASPMEVYQAPANRFVAGFVGSPTMNFLEGEIRQDGVFESSVATVPLDGTPLVEPGPAIVGVRPPDIEIVTQGEDCAGVVDVVERSGATTLIYVRPAAGHEPIRVVVPGTTQVSEGEAVRLRLNRATLHFFDPVTGSRRVRG